MPKAVYHSDFCEKKKQKRSVAWVRSRTSQAADKHFTTRPVQVHSEQSSLCICLWFMHVKLCRHCKKYVHNHNTQSCTSLYNGTSISPEASAHNLGIIFDSHLTFKDQISSVSRACFYHIRDLRCSRSVINFNAANTIGTSFVHSRLDFCNSLYYGLPKTQLASLLIYS